jgi:hypothetical protein
MSDLGTFAFGVIGGIVTGISATLIVLSGREDRLRQRIKQEQERGDTWRRNYCHLEQHVRDEDAAERQAAVDEAMAIVTRRAA